MPGYADGDPLSAMFYNPIGIAVDLTNGVFVADQLNNRIRKISASTGNTESLSVCIFIYTDDLISDSVLASFLIRICLNGGWFWC